MSASVAAGALFSALEAAGALLPAACTLPELGTADCCSSSKLSELKGRRTSNLVFDPTLSKTFETRKALLARLPPVLVPKQSVAEAARTAELVSSRCSSPAAQLAPLQLRIPPP